MAKKAEADLFVQLSNGSRLSITGCPLASSSLDDLKGAIAEQTEVPPDRQRILFAGKELHAGSKTLDKSGVGARGNRCLYKLQDLHSSTCWF